MMIKDYKYRYDKVGIFFKKHPVVLKIFFFLYKCLPPAIALIYLFLLIYSFLFMDFLVFIRISAVPAVTFICVTILRKVINSSRPYTLYDIKPLIKKDKQGESFPSRHTVSVTIIAMSCLYINTGLGIVMLVISVLMAAMRVIAGVHFAKDVIAALIIAIVCGIVVFFII